MQLKPAFRDMCDAITLYPAIADHCGVFHELVDRWFSLKHQKLRLIISEIRPVGILYKIGAPPKSLIFR